MLKNVLLFWQNAGLKKKMLTQHEILPAEFI